MRLNSSGLNEPAKQQAAAGRGRTPTQQVEQRRDRRAAFVLTQLLGLSYAEAAHACDVPVGTIGSRVARARADLLAAHLAAQAC